MPKYADELFSDIVTAQFHERYREPGPPRVRWHGYECLKCPMDLWIYQELIWQLKPQAIIEGGTCSGGSALFMAHVLDAIGSGEVITIDWDSDSCRPKHNRIEYIQGNTLDPKVFRLVKDIVDGFGPRMLILDDGHSDEHVYEELCIYTELLRTGDILIVEDTNLGGPWWGLEKFLHQDSRKWERISDAERLLLTFNPSGYWRCLG